MTDTELDPFLEGIGRVVVAGAAVESVVTRLYGKLGGALPVGRHLVTDDGFSRQCAECLRLLRADTSTNAVLIQALEEARTLTQIRDTLIRTGLVCIDDSTRQAFPANKHDKIEAVLRGTTDQQVRWLAATLGRCANQIDALTRSL